MALLTSAAIVNFLLLLTLVVILFLCPPLGVDASPVRSRHRRTADRVTHRSTAGGSSVTRPDADSLDYIDSWGEALGDEDIDEESPSEDYDEQAANDADSSASSESPSKRRREQNEALTSRMLREQRRKRRSRQHLAISALKAMTNNLQSRAVCGWTYQNNHDMSRIPVDLPEAICDYLTVPGTRNRCEQVVYNVPIRKLKESPNGIVSWSAKWLALKVGCTLATAGTVPYSVS